MVTASQLRDLSESHIVKHVKVIAPDAETFDTHQFLWWHKWKLRTSVGILQYTFILLVQISLHFYICMWKQSLVWHSVNTTHYGPFHVEILTFWVLLHV